MCSFWGFLENRRRFNEGAVVRGVFLCRGSSPLSKSLVEYTHSSVSYFLTCFSAEYKAAAEASALMDVSRLDLRR